MDFPVAQVVKNLPMIEKTRVQSLGQEDTLEKGMAIHSIILAWRIPWTKKPGRLQFTGSQRVRHDWVTITHTHTLTHDTDIRGARKGFTSKCSLVRVKVLFLAPLPSSDIRVSFPKEFTAVSKNTRVFPSVFFNPKKNVHSYDLLLSHINNNGSGVLDVDLGASFYL